MEKVRDPVLLLVVDFIADQSPKSKAGTGAVSAFQVSSADLHRAAPCISAALLLCQVWFSRPCITMSSAAFPLPLLARLCISDCFLETLLKRK